MSRTWFAPTLAALAMVSAVVAQSNVNARAVLANRRSQPGVKSKIVTAEDIVGVGQSTANLKSAIQSNPALLLAPIAAAMHGGNALINPFGLPGTGGFGGPSSVCVPHVLSFDRSVVAPGDPFNLVVTGAPGTASVVFWDTDPGPTFIPGLGNLQIGFSPGWFAEVIVIPAEGPFLEFVVATCFRDQATRVYVHAFTINPTTLETCLTNAISILFLPCGNGCSRTQGYWKTHVCNWPAPFVPVPSATQPQQCSITSNQNQWCVADNVHTIFIGNLAYTQLQLLCAFERNPNGNALVILAHQQIAAKLNVLAGATPPSGTKIADADLLIGNLNILTDSVDPSSPLGQQMTALADQLDDYNNGRDTARHCN